MEVFAKDFLSNSRLEWFCYGNYSIENAKSLATRCEKTIFSCRKDSKVLARSDIPTYRWFQLPLKKNLIFEQTLMAEKNFKPNNSGIKKIYTCGKWTGKRILLVCLLDSIISNDFFD